MPNQDHLEIVGPDGKITFHWLDPQKGISNIGKDPENDIIIQSPHIASFHAVLDHQHKPYRIMFLNEQANMRVNGNNVQANTFQEIRDWQTIELDGYTITLLEDMGKPGAASEVMEPPVETPVVPLPAPAPAKAQPSAPAPIKVPGVKVPGVKLPGGLPLPKATAPEPETPAAPAPAFVQPAVQAAARGLPMRPSDVRDNIIIAELSAREWTVDVEQPAACELVITNGGPIVAAFDIMVEGLDESWVVIYPNQVKLNESGRAVVTITMAAPRASSSLAGPHHMAVTITSPNHPGHVTRLGATLNINPYYEFTAGVLSPSRQNVSWRARSGSTSFPIQNQGNSTTSFMINAQDDENGCNFEFRLSDDVRLVKQAEVKIPAGEAMNVPLVITPLRRSLVRLRSRQYHYTVTTRSMEDPAAVRSVMGSVNSKPLFGLFSILLMLLLLGLAAFLILRPKVYEFGASKSVVEQGETLSMQWRTSPFTTNLRIDGIAEPIERSQRMIEFTPTDTGEQNFTLVGSNWVSGLLPFIGEPELSTKILVVPPYPTISAFTVDKDEILQDDNVTIKWAVASAEEVVLTVEGVPYSLKPDEFSGERVVPIHSDSLVVLEAKNYNGSVFRSSYVDVNLPTINIEKFEVTPSAISLGEEITVEWKVTGEGIEEITITPYPGKIEIDPTTNTQEGKRTFKPKENLEFVLTAKTKNEVKTEIRPVIVGPAKSAPTIDYFKAAPVKLAANDDKTVTFAWSVSGEVTEIRITNPEGFNSGNLLAANSTSAIQQGSLKSTVTKTSVYILTASNGNMTATATVDIEVAESKKPVQITILDVFPATTIAQGMEISVYFTVKPLVNGVPVDNPADVGLPELSGNVIVTDGMEQCKAELPISSCSFTPKASGTHTLTATYFGDEVYERKTTQYADPLIVVGQEVTLASPGITVNGGITVTYGITATVAFTLTPASSSPLYPPTGTFNMLVGTEAICTGMALIPSTDSKKSVGSCTTIFTSLGEKTITIFYLGDKIYNKLTLSGKIFVIPAASEVFITSPASGTFHVGDDILFEYQVWNSLNHANTPTSGSVTITSQEAFDVQTCTGGVDDEGKGSCSLQFNSSGGGNRTVQAEFTSDNGNFTDGVSPIYAYTLLNDAPVANPDTYSTDEETLLVVSAANGVLVNDSDPEGYPLTATLVTQAANYTVDLQDDGSFDYDPRGNYDYVGAGRYDADTFTYSAFDGESFSTPITVTVVVNGVNDPPDPPVLQSPSNNATGLNTSIAFAWSGSDPDVGDVLEYTVAVNSATQAITATTFQTATLITGLLPETTYNWKVSASDGFISTDSDVFTFTTRILPLDFSKTSPISGTIDLIRPVTITWETTTEADSYEYCFDWTIDSACQNDNWISTGSLTQTVITPPYDDTTYEWQVRAVNTVGSREANSGEWWTFTTLPKPGTFYLLSPYNYYTTLTLPYTFLWSTSSKASYYSFCLVLNGQQLSCDPLPNATVPPANHINVGLQESYDVTSGLTTQTWYYWRVYAWNPVGWTASSSGFLFATAPPPLAFNKRAPYNWTAYPVPIEVNLQWSPAQYATNYSYCIDTTNDNICDGDLWIPAGNVLTTTTDPLLPNTVYYWQVRAENYFGSVEANAGVWWTFLTMSPPSDFSKTAPPDNTNPRVEIPLTLSWTTSTGASSYEVCVDTTDDYTCNPVYTDTLITYPYAGWQNVGNILSTQVITLTPDTDYYWQVRAVGGGGQTEANWDSGNNRYDWWIFKTQRKPSPFGKISPTDGTDTILNTTMLTWEPSAGASSYLYCYDTTDDDKCGTDNKAWQSTTNTYASTGLLTKDTNYYWQVKAVNSFGTIEADSKAWWNFKTIPSPGVFQKGTPADGTTGLSASVTITWTTSSYADVYEYCFDTSNDSACTTPAVWTNVGTATTANLTNLSASTTYYWQVRSTNIFGTMYADGSETSGTWHSFTTMDLPTAFGKTSPANAATDQPMPLTFTWSASTGAEYYEFCYDTSDNSTCDSPSVWQSTGTATTTEVNSGFTPNTTYYWQVRAHNGVGYTYADSAWWSFTTKPLPAAFNKLTPAAPDNVNLVTPFNLTWESSTGATGYRYCYSTATTCTPADAGNVTSVSVTTATPGATYYWQVEAYNELGTTTSSGGYWTFSILNVPGAFVKSAPSDSSTPVQEKPLTITWTASARATDYQICYDTSDNNTCDSPAVWTSVGNVLTTDLTTLSPDTDYFWQVRAVNGSGSTEANAGDWWTFTTNTIPGAFTKTSPTNGQTGLLTSVDISWGTNTAAVSYKYCVYTAPDTQANCNWVTTSATSATLNGLTIGATYNWQVIAVNSFGETPADGGTWFTFSILPLPGTFSKSAPPNAGTTKLPINPTLSWGTSSNAASYEYCFDIVVIANDACTWYDTGSLLTADLAGLTPDTTYYWQVRAVNGVGITYANSGTWWSFTTLPLPGGFTKTSPADAATDVSLTPTLSWNASSDAESYAYCYDTSDNDTCNSLDSWVSTGSTTSATLSGLAPNTPYYWQVKAINGAGETLATDGWFSFTTVPAPADFGKTSPASGATNVLIPVTLDWETSDRATGYEYCITDTEPCTSWVSTGAITHTVPVSMEWGTTYHWQVRASNTYGTVLADGGTSWSFTTKSLPGSFTKSSPANNAVDQPLSLTLTWTSSSGATSYEYCYDNTNDSTCTTWIAATTTSVNIAGLTAGTPYYWQVRALNGTEPVYADGGTWATFTTEAQPASFLKVTPVISATNQSQSVTLTWGASTGAKSYKYCYDATNDDTCSGTWTSTTNTTASISGLSWSTTYYWQVVAYNVTLSTEANSGDWWAFSTYSPPGAFGKTAPTDGSSIGTGSYTFSWEASANATGYQYCYYDTANATACSSWTTTTGTSVNLDLSNNKTFKWQVRATNPAGTTYADNNTYWSFITSTPTPAP